MAGPQVTLVSGATTVTLPAPEGGTGLQRIRARTVGRTASGAVYVYDKSVSRYEALLQFRGLSAAERTALQTFFDNRSDTWTYTDSASNTYTARFLNSILEFKQAGIQGAYDVQVQLEIDTAGV